MNAKLATLVGLLLFAAVPSAPAQAGGPPARPNIVVLMIDDVSAAAMPKLLARLPRMDAFFGQNGLRFANHYGNVPLCCPGRANFLTGLYAHHNGVVRNDGRLLDPSVTIATALQDAGYFTFIAGKYLNMTDHLPLKRPPGWDHSAITSGRYYDYNLYVDGVLESHGRETSDYMTDVARARSIEFLAMAPRDRPVFALLTPFATHEGKDPDRPTIPQHAVAARRHINDVRCSTAGVYGSPSYNEADISDKPAFFQTLETLPWVKGWPLRRECEALLAVDEWFGEFRLAMARQDRIRDTLFILTADNGMAWGDHRWNRKNVAYASQLPMYVRWPAALGSTPRTVTAWTSMLDLAPTLASVARTSPLGPFPTGQERPDGLDILPTILTRGKRAPVRDALLEENRKSWVKQGLSIPAWYAIRTTAQSRLGLWHYVLYDDGTEELYDLASDPSELVNVAGSWSPDVVATKFALSVRLAELRSD